MRVAATPLALIPSSTSSRSIASKHRIFRLIQTPKQAAKPRPMDARSPLSYVGGALQQVAFVIKDLRAAQESFLAQN
jgi:hypothetical protein